MTSPDPPPAGAPVDRQRRRHTGLSVAVALLALTLVVLAIALVVALGSDDDAADSAIESASTSAAELPEDSESTADGGAEGETTTSERIDDPANSLAALASKDGAVRALAVIETDEGTRGFAVLAEGQESDTFYLDSGVIRTWTWRDEDQIPTVFKVASWVVVDVTVDGSDDLLTMLSPRGEMGAVLTGHSGKWETPLFSYIDGETEGSVVEHTDGLLTWASSALTSEVNTCDPSCAEGASIPYTWTYDADEGVFIGAMS